MTEDKLGKALMLESTRRMSAFQGLMKRFDQLTWEEVEIIVMVGVWNPETRHRMFGKLRTYQENGATKPSLVPNLKYHLMEEVADSFHMADKAGITGIGSMVFKREEPYPPWRIYNPWILVANYGEGGFGVISGKPRKGKTNLACVIIEEWTKGARQVAFSNILPADDDPPYTYTPGIRPLFQAIANLPEGIRWLFILDEGTFVYARPDQITRRVKDLDKLMRIIGKMDGSFVLVEHIPEVVPAVIQQFATSYYYCHEPGILTITLKGPTVEYSTDVRGLPKTRIGFETKDWAHFDTSGLDLGDLFSAVSGAEDRRATMREFLEAEPTPSKSKKPTKADAIRKLLREGKSLVEITREVGATYDYVRRVRMASQDSP